MTALEKLIKLASTDGAAHYRELARHAEAEYICLLAAQKNRNDAIDERLKFHMGESPCTTTNPMSK